MTADIEAQPEDSSNPGPTHQQKRQAERQAWWFSRIVVPLTLLSLLTAVPAVALISHQREIAPNPTKPSTVKERYKQVKSIVYPREPKLQTIPSDADIEQVSSALNRVLFWIEVEEADRTIAQLDTSSQEWKDLFEKTLNDEVGKQIANSELLLSKFVALQAMKPPVSNTANLKTELHLSVQGITKASFLADPVNNISKFRTISEEWNAFHQMRFNLLRLLRSDAASYSPSDLSLAEALHSRMAKDDTKRKLLVEQAIETTEGRVQMELDQLKASRNSQASIIANLQKRISEIQDGTAPQATRADYERALPAMKGLLRPFISPGYTQPKPSGDLEYGSSKKTMSYSALQRVGALDDSDEGQLILFQIGGSKSAKNSNDRPLGEFPRRNSELTTLSEVEVSLVRKAQQFIKTYGLLMIEDRLLSP